MNSRSSKKVVSILNYTGTALFVVGLLLVIARHQIVGGSLMIVGAGLVVPDYLGFTRRVRGERPAFSAYWTAKLVGLLFLILLGVFFLVMSLVRP